MKIEMRFPHDEWRLLSHEMEVTSTVLEKPVPYIAISLFDAYDPNFVQGVPSGHVRDVTAHLSVEQAEELAFALIQEARRVRGRE